MSPRLVDTNLLRPSNLEQRKRGEGVTSGSHQARDTRAANIGATTAAYGDRRWNEVVRSQSVGEAPREGSQRTLAALSRAYDQKDFTVAATSDLASVIVFARGATA